MAAMSGGPEGKASVSRAKERGESFDLPELLRVKGEIGLRLTPPNLKAAEEALRQSLHVAETRSAFALGLRAAIPLARLWAGSGRAAEARDLLRDMLGRFTEGRDSAEVKAAGALLAELDRIGAA
jgi:hypothetical protein